MQPVAQRAATASPSRRAMSVRQFIGGDDEDGVHAPVIGEPSHEGKGAKASGPVLGTGCMSLPHPSSPV
jgi:hypothetical protein